MKITIPAAALAASIMLAPPAPAVPGDPMAGCQSVGLFGNRYCDGPIRPDGSWKRCLFTQPQFPSGQYGVYTPAITNCFIVAGPGQVPAIPLGQPPHHID